MLRRIWDFLRVGWRVVTEAHTAWWLAELAGGTALIAGLMTAALRFFGEHSLAVLVIAFAFLSALCFVTYLAWLGYQREGGHKTLSVTNRPAEQWDIRVNDVIDYIVNDSTEIFAAPPVMAIAGVSIPASGTEHQSALLKLNELLVSGHLNISGLREKPYAFASGEINIL
jgi:hypothetical protein